MALELISVVEGGDIDECELGSTKLGVFVEKVGFEISKTKVKLTNLTDNITEQNYKVVHVTFDEIKLKNSSSDESSQDSCDLDSMDSAQYYTERLRDFFDGF